MFTLPSPPHSSLSCLLDFTVDNFLRELGCVTHNKIPLIPGGVVADVVSNELIDIVQFLVPESKLLYDPLPMLPRVIVLSIGTEYAFGE